MYNIKSKKASYIVRTLFAGVLSLALVFSFTISNTGLTVHADAVEEKTTVTLGADLNSDERATVLSLLGLTEDDLKDCTVLSITNEDEHNYLDDYLSSDVIGTRALSSIKLVPGEEGSGIKVTTQNISYCTESMYTNALATAGVEDAEVTVVGPFSISGTAALVGTMKAYEEITGEEISEDAKDAATNELVLTGELADAVGDSDKASELIGAIKEEVLDKGLTDEGEITDAIKETADQLGVSLTDDEISQIVDMMKKLNGLDLNIDNIKDQAQAVYDKINKLNIDVDEASGVFDKIMDFLEGIYNKLISLFN